MLTPLQAEKHFALIFRCLRIILAQKYPGTAREEIMDLDAAINTLDGPPLREGQKAALDEAGKG